MIHEQIALIISNFACLKSRKRAALCFSTDDVRKGLKRTFSEENNKKNIERYSFRRVNTGILNFLYIK